MTIEPSPPVGLEYKSAPVPNPPGEDMRLTTRSGGASADLILRLLTGGAAALILLMLAGLIVVLAHAAMPSIKAYGWGFITSTQWRPNEIERPVRDANGKLKLDEDGERVMETLPPTFGAANVIYGTTVSSVIALLFAVPLSLGAALFLVRISPELPWLLNLCIYAGVGGAVFLMVVWASGFRIVGYAIGLPVGAGVALALIRFVPNLTTSVSFLIEFLAAIPSIAYGLWGLFVLTPFLQGKLEPFVHSTLGHVPGFGWLFEQTVHVAGKAQISPIPLTGRDMLAGGLILGIMVVPIITAISRDVLRAVPRAQVEGTTALGATWWQSSKEMLKYSRAGLFGAVMLGLARAAGETMAVTMVIGNKNQIVASPFAPAQTMSSLLANEFAEVTNELHRSSLIQVALVLLVMSLAFNIVARWLVVGKQSRSAAAH
jgi:phosphate transport system permease protein